MSDKTDQKQEYAFRDRWDAEDELHKICVRGEVSINGWFARTILQALRNAYAAGTKDGRAIVDADKTEIK